MSEKRSIEVIIAGEVYKIAGTESEDHMKRVTRLLNEKISQTQKATLGRAVSKEYVLVLTAVNVCDDFVKLVEHTQLLQERLDQAVGREKQMTGRLDEYEEELRTLEQENQTLREKLAECGGE